MPKGKLLDPARKTRGILSRSKKQENATAQALGGKRTPGSGNQWHSKGDVSSKKWLVECKTTQASQYTLKVSDMNKHIIHATMAGKMPMMEVQFDSLSVVILPLNVAKEIGIYGTED